MAERKLHGGGAERHIPPLTDRFDAHRSVNQIARRGDVVEPGLASGIGEDPAVKDTSRDDADAVFHAQGQQFGQGRLVQERVPSGQHETIEVPLTRKLCEWLPRIHSGPDGRHAPLGPERCECFVRTLQRLSVMPVTEKDFEKILELGTV